VRHDVFLPHWAIDRHWLPRSYYWRYKLAFFNRPRRTALTVGIAMVVFIIWDLLGIHLNIFFHGGSQYTLPIRIAPEFPIEELFFLFLLSYVTLIFYRFLQTRMKR
jgi:lycopene cyclase domain-containing protein